MYIYVYTTVISKYKSIMIIYYSVYDNNVYVVMTFADSTDSVLDFRLGFSGL